MPDATDVQNLIRRSRAGDPAAAAALVAHLHPLVRRWVRNHRPRRESEEDLMQEVFVKLFQRLDRYREQAGVPFEHWVSRLAVRTCLDALRAERARPEWRMADLGDGEAGWLDWLLQRQAAAPEAGERDAKALIELLFARLPPADRLVLTLLDLEAHSVQEISLQTGWSRPMVKMRALRARHKLRRIAQRFHPDEFVSHE